MIVKILPVQIPVFWESIKFCAVTADEVAKEFRQVYLNELLQALLSDTAQCFVRLNDRRVLVTLMVTRMQIHKVTARKSLQIQILYSLEKVDAAEWDSDYVFLRNFATKQQCDSIIFETRHERVMELGRRVGFKEIQRSFGFNLT